MLVNLKIPQQASHQNDDILGVGVFRKPEYLVHRVLAPSGLVDPTKAALGKFLDADPVNYQSSEFQLQLARTLIQSPEVGLQYFNLAQTLAPLLKFNPFCSTIEGINFHTIEDKNHRAVFLLAISSLFGIATRTSNSITGDVVWDVMPQAGATKENSAASQTPYNIGRHSDSSFLPMPEDRFLLACIQEDRKGGGISSVLTMDQVYDELLRIFNGNQDDARQFLMKDHTFFIPAPYRHSGEDNFIKLPILFKDKNGVECLRYNMDYLIDQVLTQVSSEHHPDKKTLDILTQWRKAVEVLQPIRFLIPNGVIALFNNFMLVHDRDLIEDESRHLVRIRSNSHDPSLLSDMAVNCQNTWLKLK